MSAGIPDPINYAAAGADAALALAEAVERAPLTPDRDPAFYALLAIWLLFPLHAPLTLWVLDAPFGKFAWKGGVKRLNLPGNLAWVLMEIVAPITFAITLPADDLSPTGRTLAALYILHYLHRALLSPVMLAPKRAPVHLVVVLSAMIFNVINATLLARGLALFPPKEGFTYYFGLLLWGIGFAGNVYHDEILHDLRRPPRSRLVSTPSKKKSDHHPNGRYRIPRGCLFEYVSFPNYFCEWIEWVGFAIAAAPSVFVPVPKDAIAETLVSYMGKTYDMSVVAALLPPFLLSAPWAFVLAEVASMMPRAIRGHKWYRDEFELYPPERKAVIPGVI